VVNIKHHKDGDGSISTSVEGPDEVEIIIQN
jgi:hypothetical protein